MTESALREALRKAEEEKIKSDAIIAAIGDGISIQDTDYRILYQNEVHKKLVGAHPGEYCYEAYERRGSVCEGCPVALSYLDGRVHTVERTAPTEQGMIYVEITSSPLRDSTGNIIAGIEVARDITARKNMEKDRNDLVRDLQGLIATVGQSQKEWRDTFDSIQDPIYITDAEYRIVKANKAFSVFSGMDFPEILGRKCHEVLHNDTVPYHRCPHQSLQETGEPADIEITSPDGKLSLIVSHFPYYGLEGEFSGSICIVRDVTVDREKEMRFIMSERLASLGQMAASIAHEINNPLAAILGCAEGLMNRVKQDRYDPELFKKYLNIVMEEVDRCKKITTGMLFFVRKSVAEKKTCDLHAILNQTLEIIALQGRLNQVEVRKQYGAEACSAFGSEGELRQVFLSLLTNALDAMNDKGVLTIRTGKEGGVLTITISDSGAGIPKENLNRIFEPFFTTKSDQGGTGLGLSITRKILTNHGGDITVSSEQGNGATFTITLPPA